MNKSIIDKDLEQEYQSTTGLMSKPYSSASCYTSSFYEWLIEQFLILKNEKQNEKVTSGTTKS